MVLVLVSLILGDLVIQTKYIGVGPITQYMHMHNKNSNTQGSSPNVVKVIFHTLRNCSERKEFAPSGSKFFPLREYFEKVHNCRESMLDTVVYL